MCFAIVQSSITKRNVEDNIFTLGSCTTFQKLKHMKQTQVEKKPGKRSSKKSIETPKTSSSAIGGKDTSLFLFRVLGKILYCKSK